MALVEDFSGQDATLLLTDEGNTEVPISNVTVDVEANTTDVQHNDNLNPTHVTTGMRYSGSFEYEGINIDLFDKLLNKDDVADVNQTADLGTISIREQSETVSEGASNEDFDRNIVVRGVKVTSMSRDTPGDDVTSVSIDFVAESVKVLT